MSEPSTAAAERLRRLTGAARARNGRLAIDWMSRRQQPRWRMALLDGQHYNRGRLRRALEQRPPPPAVPGSRRRMTQAELEALRDPNPWRLYDPRAAEDAAANAAANADRR
jgi:hypothetical protein